MALSLIAGQAAPSGMHPLFVRYRDEWRFYELSYLGGRDYIAPDIHPEWTFVSYQGSGATEHAVGSPGVLASFLFPYSREQAPFFDQRRRRSMYRNLCQPTLDMVRNLTLQEAVSRSADGALTLEAVWRDVDQQGRDVNEWMRDGLTQALIHGAAFAVADLARYEPGDILTLADERAAGVRPYVTWYAPGQVPDWEIDRRGALQRLTVLEADFRPDAAGHVAPTTRAPLWRTLWPDRWEVREGQDGKVVDAGVNTLGRVPCEVLFAQRMPGVRDPIGVSFLHTIARLNQEIYNRDSLLGELHYRQGPFLAVPGGEALSRAEVGLEAAFAVPAGAGSPAWVTMEGTPYDVLKQDIAELVLAIRAHAGLSRGSGEQSIAARSGEALLVETQDKRAMLSGYRHECQDFEIRLWGMVAEMAGQVWTGSVRYSDKYATSAFSDEVAEVKALLDLPITDAAKKELTSELVRRRLAYLSAERLDEIMREPEQTAERPNITLAPTDAAKVVTVNEARLSIGLSPAPVDGDKTLAELGAPEPGFPNQGG